MSQSLLPQQLVSFPFWPTYYDIVMAVTFLVKVFFFRSYWYNTVVVMKVIVLCTRSLIQYMTSQHSWNYGHYLIIILNLAFVCTKLLKHFQQSQCCTILEKLHCNDCFSVLIVLSEFVFAFCINFVLRYCIDDLFRIFRDCVSNM